MASSDYSDAEDVGFLDVESQDEASRGRGLRITMRHIVAAVAGVAAVGTCGVVMRQSAPAPVEEKPMLTARSLFESPAIHDVATDNVMNIKARIPQTGKHRDEVRELVAKTFKDIVEKMQEQSPEHYKALNSVALSQEHHDGAVHMMRLLRDPRMMQIGLDTAKAIQETNSDDENILRAAIIDKLKARGDDIRNIYKEMPQEAHAVATSNVGDGFKSIFAKHKLGSLKTLKGKFYDQFTTPTTMVADRRLLPYRNVAAAATANPTYAQPTAMSYAQAAQQPHEHSWQQHVSKPYQTAEEVLGIVDTAVDEANALIRIVSPLEKIFPGGHDLNIPPIVTSSIGGADALLKTVDCELDAVADGNMEEGIGCPMMSASAAMDMCREPLTLLGILGDNKPGNGHQGNHAGGGAHQGIFDDTAAGKEMKDEVKGQWPACMFWGQDDCETGTGTHSPTPTSTTHSLPPPTTTPVTTSVTTLSTTLSTTSVTTSVTTLSTTSSTTSTTTV